MINFVKSNKKYIIVLTILFVFVSLSGTTYSLFLQTEATNTFSYNTGILDLQFIEDEQVSLESAFPINDSEALKNEPYTLTIKNTGSLPYLFNLKMLSSTDKNVINSKYIKVKVNDQLPHTLYSTNNEIYSNVILYPGEEKTFNINIWLDINTPNVELGKKFIAKITTTGSSIYKTLDSSGANHPILKENMLPIYYDEVSKTWKKADDSNTIETYEWYNYDKQKWANVAIIKNTSKKIYDITRNNNLDIDKIIYNNDNAIINENYLELSLNNYNYDKISNIIRIKFNNIKEDKINIITNGKISYYYDVENKKFIFTNGSQVATSATYNIEEDKWYIIGYTYDSSNVNFYINGNKLSKVKIEGTIKSDNNFKLGTDKTFKKVSNITVGDVYFYNDILTDNEISSNYNTTIKVLYDNLIAGYNGFTPMTLAEYYLAKSIGTTINNEDISMYYVWIPRYKYKLWNVTGESNIDYYDAYNKGIDIQFEKGTTSSGVIHCKDNQCYNDELLITKVTKNDNGKYYTHPAFKNENEQMTGLWVSKYEVSTNNNTCNEENPSGCLSNKLTIEVKPNNYVWRNNYLSNFYQAIKKTDTDYNIIKNSEWGAVAYLSHSKYGLCQNNQCTEIGTNNTYISGNDKTDTTTNTIYGVFDMGGSATEFTMANYTNEFNKLSLDNTNFNKITINNNDYNLYYENTFILGDATKELSLENGIWYNNNENFINSTNNWFIRGGILDREGSGIFYYNATTDLSSNYISTRIVVK